jgi:hypothetical protein
MNKVKFLVCNINTGFPAEINEIIFKKVQENAAKAIQNMYYLRVKINLDCLFILKYDCRVWMRRHFWFHRVKGDYINNIIMYYLTRVRYKYIQEPGIWIESLNDILSNYIHLPGKSLEVNNIITMINRIRAGNSIWSRTHIDWWQNL